MNILFNIITFKGKTVIPPKFQIFVVTWYHMYVLTNGKDVMEEIICQYFYWIGI